MSDHTPLQAQTTVGAGERGHSAEVDCFPLACPVLCRHRRGMPLRNTCVGGFKDCRRVKDHLKNFHKCDCGTGDGRGPCREPAHVSQALMDKILHGMPRRSSGAPQREQWEKIYRILYPDDETEVPPAYLPTGEQLRAIARAPPEEFVKALEARLQKVVVGDTGGHFSPVGHFFLQFQHFYDLVCRGGTVPCPRSPVPATTEKGAPAKVAEASVSSQGGVAAAVLKSWGDDLVNWEG